MTELVPDPSPTRPKRGKWLAILLLLIVGVAVAYYQWQRLKKAEAVPAEVAETAAVSPVSATTSPAPAAPQTAPEPAPVQTLKTTPEAPAVAPDPVAPPAPPPTPAPTPITTGEAVNPVAPSTTGLEEAVAAQKAGRLQEAREKAQAVLEQVQGNPVLVAEAEKVLGAIHTEQLFTPRPMPEKSDYTVQPGDSLDRIARKYGTTVELIQKGNNVRGALIKAGDRLRVFSGTWAIRVNKTRNDLLLTLNGKFFKRYRVGTGEFSKTPVGEFKIVDRIAQPTWWHPDGRTIPFGDPENLLGTHWLALDIKGYGIHGTWEPETVGKQSSLGCVRLINEEVEELFTLVTIGTPVIIEE